jgi:2-polyprenyl-3-methyl-5-hydroxy-6-metoxy-1,4-benzoquinol methylase
MADVARLGEHGIEVHCARATELSQNIKDPVDVVFMSNFLEHLPDKHTLLSVLSQCCAVLKSGGHIMVLQPNIRYVGPAYWDYIDHHIALTENSLVEALDISGFKVETLIPRFLPYTAKSTLGHVARYSAAASMRLYLRIPLVWKVFGGQTFVTAAKVGTHDS